MRPIPVPAGIGQRRIYARSVALLTLLRKADGVPQAIVAGNTLGGYLRSRCPGIEGTEVGSSTHVRATWPVPGAFGALYTLVLGDLVQLCSEAERAQGIRPIRVA